MPVMTTLLHDHDLVGARFAPAIVVTAIVMRALLDDDRFGLRRRCCDRSGERNEGERSKRKSNFLHEILQNIPGDRRVIVTTIRRMKAFRIFPMDLRYLS
jgi:hypothetical protein